MIQNCVTSFMNDPITHNIFCKKKIWVSLYYVDNHKPGIGCCPFRCNLVGLRDILFILIDSCIEFHL
jgi:hypothetical protein